MKLVMTLAGADDAEVLEAQLSFHLHAGVDLVVVEEGGTPEIRAVLDAYRNAGHLHMVDRPGGGLSPGQRLTAMARLAATTLGADWVINNPGGEYMWPRGGSLRDVLKAVPKRYGLVRALPRSFVRTRSDSSLSAEGVTIRLSTAALVARADEAAAALGAVQAAHPDVVVDANGVPKEGSLAPLRGWYPFEVFRFPVARQEETLAEAVVTADLARGALVVDVRLSEALRALRIADTPAAGRRFALPSDGRTISFQQPSLVDAAGYAEEIALLGEVDDADVEARLDDMERSIASFERSVGSRIRALRSRRRRKH
jgi:hypothetical protein